AGSLAMTGQLVPAAAIDALPIGVSERARVERITPPSSLGERVAMADRYATKYLFSGRKRIVELRSSTRTPNEQKASASQLRQLFLDVSKDLKNDFGASVSIRFVVGRPMTRLGLSVVDDFEAMWLALSDIIKEIRSGDLEP